MYINEYMQAGSGIPVDCTVGLRTMKQAIQHGQWVCINKNYCGFWVSKKIDGEIKKLEFHAMPQAPDGNRVPGEVTMANN